MRGIAFRDQQKVYTKGSEIGYSLATIEKVLGQNQELKIEQQTDGDVAYDAYYRAEYNGSSREWAEKQIERGIGDVAWAAYLMSENCGSSQEWMQKQLERKIGDVAGVTYQIKMNSNRLKEKITI